MNIDIKQAGVIATLTATAIGLWFAGHKLGIPPSCTAPTVIGILGIVAGMVRSPMQAAQLAVQAEKKGTDQ